MFFKQFFFRNTRIQNCWPVPQKIKIEKRFEKVLILTTFRMQLMRRKCLDQKNRQTLYNKDISFCFGKDVLKAIK